MSASNAQPAKIGDSPRPRTRIAASLRWTALIASVFCLVLWFGLLAEHFLLKTDDPLKSRRIEELKAQLRVAPKDEAIKGEIRTLDLRLRSRYFRHLKLTDNGSWMLLAGGILFLAVAKTASDLEKKPYLPHRRGDRGEKNAQITAFARTSVAAVALVAISALLTLAFSTKTAVPRNSGDLEKLLGANSASSAQPVSDVPPRSEYNKNWHQFRGPLGSGISFDPNPPNFEAANLAWKTEVPAPGFNSPIVWGNRIFLSGGTETKREVFCFKAESGELLWRQPVQVANSKAGDVSVPESTGYAPSTMATDGRRVYVIFVNYDLAAFTFDGQLLWAKNLGKPNNQYGHASSLATWQDRVIVQLDQGHEDDHLSKLYAFDGKTGNVVWQRPRPVDESWSSPMLIEAAGKAQIVTLAVPWIIGYAAQDGTELWRLTGLSGEITPSPAFGAGFVFAVSPNDTLLAIRPDGQGDVSKTHIAWKSTESAPEISSPAATEELVFAVSTMGLLTCQEAQTGKKVWEHDLQTEVFASPVIAGGRLYLLSTKGTAITVQAGREFRELSRTDLNEPLSATPAIAQNRIFIRGQKHLFCFGADVKKVAEK